MMNTDQIFDGFDVRKIAHIAARFILRADGRINHLKLMKLIYLANRKFMEKYDLPIVFDDCVSMDCGPALSQTVNLSNGNILNPIWEDLIKSEARHSRTLHKDISVEALDELSRADLGVLNEIWEEYGALDQWELVEMTHSQDVCPEWENPHGKALPIPYERILKFLSKERSEEIAEEIESYRSLARAFAMAR